MNHIMIDLEMNTIQRRISEDKRLSSELIEIGAVKMDENYEVTDKYQSYVSPQYGEMDVLITQLTGITDDMLEGAPCFQEALDAFARWIGEEPARFYSWSMADLRQFQNEAAFKGYTGEIIARMEKNWTDFQQEYSRLLGISRKIKLNEAVGAADYEFTGDQHTALADAVNTAEILRLSKDPKEFERVMKPVLDLFRPEKKEQTLLEMHPEFFAALLKNLPENQEES